MFSHNTNKTVIDERSCSYWQNRMQAFDMIKAKIQEVRSIIVKNPLNESCEYALSCRSTVVSSK